MKSTRIPASVRFNNPGAQYPGQSARKFGTTGTAVIGGGHLIAKFDDPVSGAAAMFDLLDKGYVGKTLRSAIYKWSGGNDAGAYIAQVAKRIGVYAGTVLTKEFLRSAKGIELARAMARIEAGKEFPLSHDQWRQAQDIAFRLKSENNPYMEIVDVG